MLFGRNADNNAAPTANGLEHAAHLSLSSAKNSQIIDEEFAISDVGFPLTQSIFGANKNLIQYLNDGRLQECVDNGIIDIQSAQIVYIGD